MNTSQHIGFSEFAESIDFTLFEQTDESNISLVKRIISHKDRYYLLNTQGYTHCTILVFDKQGNFIYKLDKRGGGPDEYVELEDFAIDKKNDELVLLTYPKGIYVYDLEGNFIRKDLGKHGRDVAVDAKGNIYQTMRCSEESPFRLLYISPNDTCFYAPVEKKTTKEQTISHSKTNLKHSGTKYIIHFHMETQYTMLQMVKISLICLSIIMERTFLLRKYSRPTRHLSKL